MIFCPLLYFQSRSKLLTITGSGILVGTALAIIIPEGVNSIYSEPQCMKMPTNNNKLHMTPKKDDQNLANPNDIYNTYISNDINEETRISNDEISQKESDNPSRTFVIGLALVSGFVLMLLIDQFSSSRNQVHDYNLAPSDDYDMASGSHRVKDSLHVSISPLNHHSNPNICNSHIQPSPKVTPTLGLVIHASADGIALGAAATTSHRETEMIIFLAIMLHKAPAAFGLVAFLLHRGLKHATIRRHLLAFSLSAPLAAFMTFFGLSQSGKEALQRHNATGIAMLFSAGTFLYVATVHVLPELVHNRRLSSKEILCFIVGAFLPSLIAQLV